MQFIYRRRGSPELQEKAISLAISLCCSIIMVSGFVVPSVVVAAQDKNISCSKNLWSWILVCNIAFAVNSLIGVFAPFLKEGSMGIVQTVNLLLTLFLFAWSIVGIVWATSSGVKDTCGNLYKVALGDSIAIISLYGLICCLACCMIVFFMAAMSNTQFY
ncbi:hypothetical protein M0811_03248 [Anaeramoeba ignava]|uniref:Uncharacterized protein n=1 Tax=Anaeramoeba ignava TaxID=1746090 RepID=A0A9Q0L6Z5_ANAIG|nr:hypothetical protein M0811_03248 [Anaeramoeba ignava]